MKQEKARLKAEEKNKLKTVDTKMMQNKKVVNIIENNVNKDPIDHNRNINTNNEFIENTLTLVGNDNNYSNIKQKNNEIIFNYQSNLKTKSNFGLTSSLFDDG